MIPAMTSPGEGRAHADPAAAAPLTQPDAPLLRQLAAIYCSVRQVSSVDVDADLLELGLSSLDAIRIANLIFEETGTEIAMDEFLRRPTLRAVAEQLARGQAMTVPVAGPPSAVAVAPPAGPADWEEFTL